jgi:hypothetical protein
MLHTIRERLQSRKQSRHRRLVTTAGACFEQDKQHVDPRFITLGADVAEIGADGRDLIAAT